MDLKAKKWYNGVTLKSEEMMKKGLAELDVTEEKIKEFKLHREVLKKEGSLRLQVEEEELKIKGKVLEVKKEAEQIVAEARRKAAELKEKADETGLTEAKKVYEEEMEKIKTEAEKIRRGVSKEIEELEVKGKQNLEKATAFIWGKVVPQN